MLHKAYSIFAPLQFGVACYYSTEQVVHSLRKCIEKHWGDEDFVVLKVDMRNAFDRHVYLNVPYFSQNSSQGQVSAMVHILICGTP